MSANQEVISEPEIIEQTKQSLLSLVGIEVEIVNDTFMEPAEQPVVLPVRDISLQRAENIKRTRRSSSKLQESIGLYLNDIGKIPLINTEKETELSKKVHAGQEASSRIAEGEDPLKYESVLKEAVQAKQEFILANLRLVVSIAKNYPEKPTTDVMDYISAGNIGLKRAVEKFDWKRGFKFSTYATFWIRQSIGRAIDNSPTIHLPSEVSSNIRAALREAGNDSNALNPAQAQLYRLANPVSLNKPINADFPEASLEDVIASKDMSPEDTLIAVENLELFDKLLSTLSSQDRALIESRFGLNGNKPKTLKEIGKDINATGEAARRRINSALKRLKDNPESATLLAEFR
ncbi:sigma-70 family RNA polymerase sigma factor [Candidatus Saccharibacteria bacterium]|nr:sigma-70 family RNA polymerase sigma factor [Candidatus Saccharibacteria bacterium]